MYKETFSPSNILSVFEYSTYFKKNNKTHCQSLLFWLSLKLDIEWFEFRMNVAIFASLEACLNNTTKKHVILNPYLLWCDRLKGCKKSKNFDNNNNKKRSVKITIIINIIQTGCVCFSQENIKDGKCCLKGINHRALAWGGCFPSCPPLSKI